MNLLEFRAIIHFKINLIIDFRSRTPRRSLLAGLALISCELALLFNFISYLYTYSLIIFVGNTNLRIDAEVIRYMLFILSLSRDQPLLSIVMARTLYLAQTRTPSEFCRGVSDSFCNKIDFA